MSDTPGFIDAVTGELAGDTPSESGVAYAGHTDMREFAERRDAAALIESFAVIDEDGGYTPNVLLGLEALAIEIAAQEGRTAHTIGDEAFKAYIADKLSVIQSGLADRRAWSRTSEQRERQGYLGSVSLYTPPEGERYQDRSHATAPAVCFYEIRFNSFLWSPARRAMAVWFTPEVERVGQNVFPVRPGVSKRDGTLYSNDKFEAGYQSIVAFFPSLSAGKQAYRDLLAACQLAARPARTADADEVTVGPDGLARGDFRGVMAHEQDLTDAQTARQSVQRQARRQIAAC